MKSLRTSLVLMLSAATLSVAVQAHEEAGPPQHGGVVALAQDLEYELLVQPTTLQIYVRDHGKPVDLSKASAKVTLLASGKTQEASLQGTGAKLEAQGNFEFTPGAKAVAVIQRPGHKTATVRFVSK